MTFTKERKRDMKQDKWIIENIKDNNMVYSYKTKTLYYLPTTKVIELDNFYAEITESGYEVEDARCVYYYS